MDNHRNRNDNDVELCLVCCSKVECSKENDNLLCRNLLVIFLLKNVMQVADKQLEENLRNNGNPVDWIRLCEECCQLSKQALDLHCLIVKTDRELGAVQKLIVEKTKSSNKSLSVMVGHQNSVWRGTRVFVKNSNFQSGSLPVNPFIEGDKLATANYYFRQNLDDLQDILRSNKEDDVESANFLKIKTEQLRPQLISDDEADDGDWPMDNNEDKEDSENNYQLKKNNKKAASPHRKKVNGKIQCKFCSKLFYTSSGCSKHEEEKHPSIPNQYPCSICGMTWNSGVYLQKHMSRKHRVELNGSQLAKLKSSLVDQDEMNKEKGQNSVPSSPTVKAEPLQNEADSDNLNDEGNDVEWHLDDDENYKDVTQEEMDSDAIESTVKRARNRKRIMVNGKFKCYYCDKVCAKSSGCYRHEYEKHPKILGRFPCEICGKPWNTNEYLMKHKKEAHVSIPNQYPCQLCGKTWNSASYLRKHVGRMHKNGLKVEIPPRRKVRLRVNGKVKCYFCDKLFSRVNACHRHESEQHAKIPARFPCDICGKAWNRKEYLMRHRKQVHKIGLAEKKDPLSEILESSKDANALEMELSPERVETCEKEPLDDNQVDTNIPTISTPKGKTELERDDDDHVGECDDDSDWQLEDEEHSISSSVEDTEDKINEKKKAPLNKSRKRAPPQSRERINGKIKCNFCDKLFTGTAGCYMHEKEKHPQIPAQFRCDICDRAWNSREYLSRHLTRSHGIEKPEEKQEFFPKIHDSSSQLTNSDEVNQVETDSPLNSPSKVRPELGPDDKDEDKMELGDDDLQLDDIRSAAEGDEDEDQVRKKMRKAMGVVLDKNGKLKRLGCKFCDKTFRDRYNLGRHERSHKNEKRRKQKRSEQSSKSDWEWRRQRGSPKLEWVDGKVKCSKCDKLFTNAVSLRNHETTHKYKELICKAKGNRTFEWVDGKLKCGSCDREFCTEKGLITHEREQHKSDDVSEFICELCGKACLNLYKLKGHKKRVHLLKTDGSPWIPPPNYKPKKEVGEEYGLPSKDGKGKRGINYLRVDGKLKCNSCDRLFISADGLYKHERAKHPIRPGEFVCTHCGMAFNSLDYLSKHTERKHWLRLDGTQKIPPWVATRKYKWKKSEK